MIRPLKPLTQREEEVVSLVFIGKRDDQIAALTNTKRSTVVGVIRRASEKIGGPRWAGPRTRCLIWKAMEIGVLQYLAAVRGDDGRLLTPPPHAIPILVRPHEPELP